MINIGVLLPLTAQKEVTLGTLGVFWRRPIDEPNEEQLAMIEELAAMAGRALQNARRFHEVFELSVRDSLTGLHNRHYFHETLAHEVQRAHRYDRRLALIFFDIDDFGQINEELGHLGADGVLEELAHRLRSVVAAPTSRAGWAATSSPSSCPSRRSMRLSDSASGFSSRFRASRLAASLPSGCRQASPSLLATTTPRPSSGASTRRSTGRSALARELLSPRKSPPSRARFELASRWLRETRKSQG